MPAKKKKQVQPLFEGSEWDFTTLQRAYDAVEDVALNDLGLDIYPNQIEIISSEQMLDAYSSVGLPLMYNHWSFGKHFVREEKMYSKGYTGLAYEIVINSNPCISYNLEDNTMAMQTLVMAHAAFGHNHFFKNNNVFRQWTDADGILDYLQFAKSYVSQCEDKHGHVAVEEMLDSAHAVMDYGVFRYRRPPKLSLRDQIEKERDRREYEDRTFNDLWRTLPKQPDKEEPSEAEEAAAERRQKLKLPEENLLYFMEKNSPSLEPWQREILRIVRNISQYFYAQKQTKVMNEGCATFIHHYIVNTLYDRGLLSEGALLEILHSHSNVVFQPGFDDRRFGGVNPYALGFGMMEDIRRISTEPTDEDRDWFPAFAGAGDWRDVLKDAWANYRDESFIRQYLSPEMMRKLKLFSLADREEDSHYTVTAIHDERGYENLRNALAHTYDPSMIDPDIQVADLDLRGDRRLRLQHTMRDGIRLDSTTRDEVLKHIKVLWGYEVSMTGVDRGSDKKVYEVSTAKM